MSDHIKKVSLAWRIWNLNVLCLQPRLRGWGDSLMWTISFGLGGWKTSILEVGGGMLYYYIPKQPLNSPIRKGLIDSKKVISKCLVQNEKIILGLGLAQDIFFFSLWHYQREISLTDFLKVFGSTDFTNFHCCWRVSTKVYFSVITKIVMQLWLYGMGSSEFYRDLE